jgi:hypothetical protein
MPNPKSETTSASDFDLWVAQAVVSPVTHHGTKEECEAWGDAMRGRDVYVIDADGNPQMIGVVGEIVGGPFAMYIDPAQPIQPGEDQTS